METPSILPIGVGGAGASPCDVAVSIAPPSSSSQFSISGAAERGPPFASSAPAVYLLPPTEGWAARRSCHPWLYARVSLEVHGHAWSGRLLPSSDAPWLGEPPTSVFVILDTEGSDVRRVRLGERSQLALMGAGPRCFALAAAGWGGIAGGDGGSDGGSDGCNSNTLYGTLDGGSQRGMASGASASLSHLGDSPEGDACGRRVLILASGAAGCAVGGTAPPRWRAATVGAYARGLHTLAWDAADGGGEETAALDRRPLLWAASHGELADAAARGDLLGQRVRVLWAPAAAAAAPNAAAATSAPPPSAPSRALHYGVVADVACGGGGEPLLRVTLDTGQRVELHASSAALMLEASTAPVDVARLAPATRAAGVGLSNLGGTCYLNAALQVLAATEGVGGALALLAEPLRRGVAARVAVAATLSDGASRSGRLTLAVADVCALLRQPPPLRPVAGIPAFPKALLGEASPAFAGSGEQDAHEALMALFVGLAEDATSVVPHARPPPPVWLAHALETRSCGGCPRATRVLTRPGTPGGELLPSLPLVRTAPPPRTLAALASRARRALACTAPGALLQLFLHSSAFTLGAPPLMVVADAAAASPPPSPPPPPPPPHPAASSNLAACLSQYFSPEVVTAACERCGGGACAITVRSWLVPPFPSVLVLHVKREALVQTLPGCDDPLPVRLRFPLRGLSLGAFVHPPARGGRCEAPPPRYDLRGVVCLARASGEDAGSGAGHFTAFARHNKPAQGADPLHPWRFCDDSRVVAASDEDVSSSWVGRQAYVLVYEAAA